MPLKVVEEGGLKLVEGEPNQPFMTSVDDSSLLLEACFSNQTRATLLYSENLPNAFFDLSSGQAGAILQHLRNYGVRLAVVCVPGTVRFSSRFGEKVAEERQGPYFGLFETRSAALEWLGGS
jgi:hypothetical protein